jgi:predicted ribosome quality control (RQC) complex YloA/Tae2 family protein
MAPLRNECKRCYLFLFNKNLIIHIILRKFALAGKEKFSTCYPQLINTSENVKFVFGPIFGIFFYILCISPMVSNFFTYLHVAAEIGKRISNRIISDIYTQTKNQLCIQINGDPPSTIVISCEPAENFLFIREGTARARNNSVSVLHDAVGKNITAVECRRNDRVVEIYLESSAVILCEMFGSRANILLCDRGENVSTERHPSAVIHDSFLRRKEMIGAPLELSHTKEYPWTHILLDDAAFITTVRKTEAVSIVAVVRTLLPWLGTMLAKEAVYRSRTALTASLQTVTDRELSNIRLACVEIINDLLRRENPRSSRIYVEDRAPVCFSLLPLTIFEELPFDEFSTISAGIQHFISRVRRSSHFLSSKQHLFVHLDKEEKKTATILEKITQEHRQQNRAGEYERFGKLVMANIYQLHKGQKVAVLHDPLESAEAYSITLDPALSPVQNAERYFEKAKKARGAQLESGEREQHLQRRRGVLQSLIPEVLEVNSPESLKQFFNHNSALLKEVGYLKEKEQKELPPFRIFTVDGGFQVLAGKSSENNDLLTMKYAKPDDLWFHCRGSSGSHVVLKSGSGRGEPSKKAITQAAAIAAYYSKMKNASLIPVAMTKRKFVRKPKGVPPGTVTIEREKVIFVEAQLPEEEQP